VLRRNFYFWAFISVRTYILWILILPNCSTSRKSPRIVLLLQLVPRGIKTGGMHEILYTSLSNLYFFVQRSTGPSILIEYRNYVSKSNVPRYLRTIYATFYDLDFHSLSLNPTCSRLLKHFSLLLAFDSRYRKKKVVWYFESSAKIIYKLWKGWWLLTNMNGFERWLREILKILLALAFWSFYQLRKPLSASAN
jgi:hypothetical protein